MHGLRMFDTASIKERYEKYYGHFRQHDEELLKQVEQEPIKGWMTCREAINYVKKMSSSSMEYKL